MVENEYALYFCTPFLSTIKTMAGFEPTIPELQSVLLNHLSTSPKHALNDSNAYLMGWSHLCCHYTKDV